MQHLCQYGEWLESVFSSEKCTFIEKKHLKKKQQRHKDPERRDRQQNKTHQTLMPKLPPLITSFSSQILTDPVNLHLSLRIASMYVPFPGDCDYFGKKVRKTQHLQWRKRCAYTLVCIWSLWKQHETTSWFRFGRHCSAVSKIALHLKPFKWLGLFWACSFSVFSFSQHNGAKIASACSGMRILEDRSSVGWCWLKQINIMLFLVWFLNLNIVLIWENTIYNSSENDAHSYCK